MDAAAHRFKPELDAGHQSALQRALLRVLVPTLLLTLSLRAVLPVDARTLLVPATAAGSHPGRRPADSSCSLSLTTGRGKTYTFSHCYAAQGGFSILWNHTADGSDSLISMAVQKKWRGWTAFGTSPGGEMPQGSAIMSIYKRGRYTVQQYYLSDKDPEKGEEPEPKPGGNLVASDLKGEYARGLMTTFATIKLPTAQAQGCVNLLYAAGQVNLLRKPKEHEEDDAHHTQVVYVPTATPPICKTES